MNDLFIGIFCFVSIAVVIGIAIRVELKSRRRYSGWAEKGLQPKRPKDFHKKLYYYRAAYADFQSVSSIIMKTQELDYGTIQVLPGAVIFQEKGRALWEAVFSLLQTDGSYYIWQFRFSRIRTSNGTLVGKEEMNAALSAAEQALRSMDPDMMMQLEDANINKKFSFRFH